MKRVASLVAIGLLAPLPALLALGDEPVDPAAHGIFDNPPWVLSFTNPAMVPGVGTVRGEDLVTYDPDDGSWGLLFDGSDVGLGPTNVDAAHLESSGGVVSAIYFSLANPAFDIPGLIGGPSGMTVTENDVVRFTPTSLGPNTAGSFEFFLDGSDVGLAGNDGDIDGLFVYPTGAMVISTKGHIATPSLGAMADEDGSLLTVTSTGSMTSGTFSRFFDGSDVGFCCIWQEDVDGLYFATGTDPASNPGTMIYSTTGHWNVVGSQGNDEDLGIFIGAFGAQTGGFTFKSVDLTQAGIAKNEDVDAVSRLD